MAEGRVYVRNAGMVFATASCLSDLVPFSSIDLESGSANDKGFTQRAERLEQDMESFADNRKKGREQSKLANAKPGVLP